LALQLRFDHHRHRKSDGDREGKEGVSYQVALVIDDEGSRVSQNNPEYLWSRASQLVCERQLAERT